MLLYNIFSMVAYSPANAEHRAFIRFDPTWLGRLLRREQHVEFYVGSRTVWHTLEGDPIPGYDWRTMELLAAYNKAKSTYHHLTRFERAQAVESFRREARGD